MKRRRAGGTMKKEFIESVNAVIPHWSLILGIGVVGVLGANGFWQEFAVPGLIVNVLIMIVIFGKIVSVCVQGEPASAKRLLSENWLNYVAAVVILRLPQAAIPIVFLKKSSLAAVLAGIVYLFKNLAASTWIAGVVVITYVLTTVGTLVFRLETTPWSFVLALAAVMTGLFLSFVTYVGALRVLAAGGEEKSGSPA